ncbi:MAG: DsbA family protein [Candidatus Rokuibacteriota bacterium]
MSRVVGIVVSAILLALAAVPPSSAQAPTLTTLQEDIAKLRKELEGVRRELQEMRGLLQQRASPPAVEARTVVLGVGDVPFKGAADARVTLVEFTDYQCPFCARHLRSTLPQLQDAYIKTGKLKYVVRDFPLESIHPAAVKAAEAGHCAAEGGKYWEMHDRLFANPRALDADDLVGHAEAVGLNPQTFRQCLDSAKYGPRVRESVAEGERAGVRGTPSFFLGLTDPKGKTITAVTIIRGAQPFARFEEAIEKLLAAPK